MNPQSRVIRLTLLSSAHSPWQAKTERPSGFATSSQRRWMAQLVSLGFSPWDSTMVSDICTSACDFHIMGARLSYFKATRTLKASLPKPIFLLCYKAIQIFVFSVSLGSMGYFLIPYCSCFETTACLLLQVSCYELGCFRTGSTFKKFSETLLLKGAILSTCPEK